MTVARGTLPAGTYHVTARGAGPVPVFHDDVDRTHFCMLLARTITKLRWVCRAFCLMTTHYHLLLDVPENSLQAGMQAVNGVYAKAFNIRHGRTGHLFGRRYYCGMVDSDVHLLESMRYIARNPVRSRLVTRPADWYWSSYRGCAGIDADFPFVDSSTLRAYFGADERRASERLRAFVEDI